MSTEKKKKRRVAKLKKKKKNVLGWTEKSFGLKQKRSGLKKVFLGWKTFGLKKKSILGWKIKGNTPKEKKKKAGRKEKKKSGGWPGNRKEKRKCAALKEKEKEGWNRERVLNKEGWIDNFLAFIFLRIFSEKNYGELVCVGFNF